MKTKHPGLVKLGKNVRYYRTMNNLNQEELAFRCSVDRGYISDVERGKRNIAAINLMRIAKALGVEVGRLFPPINEVSLK